MKTFIKLAVVAIGLLGTTAAPVLAHGRGHRSHESHEHAERNTIVTVEVYRVPRGDWLNVRNRPSPRAHVVGRIWNGDQAWLDLSDCWDIRWGQQVPAWRVDFDAANLWCGIRAGGHGELRGYVRTSYLH